jgi:hypothetical protein
MENLEKAVFKPIQNLNPKKTMIFYSNEEDKNYVEVREVDKNGKMLVGKPASLKTINFLKDLVVDNDDEKNITKIDCKPNNFFWLDNSIDNTLIAWTCKPEKQIISIGAKNRTYYCPNTFWVYDGEDVYVFAYKKFRHFQTRLYRLATPNVYDNGKICWGNALSKRNYVFKSLKMIKHNVQSLFWESDFNNHLQSGLPIDEEVFYNMGEKDQYKKHIEIKSNIKDVLNALNKKLSI